MPIIYFLIFLLLDTGMNGWSEEITIYATGLTQGRLEQCGCSTDIEGGLEARAGFLEKARAETPEAILIDVGGFMPPKKGKKKPAFLLSQEDAANASVGETNLRAMALMRYDVALAAPGDLAYGLVLKTIQEESRFILGTNADPKADWILPYKVCATGGLRIGIIGAISLAEKNVTLGGGERILPAGRIVAQSVATLRERENVDAVVMLAHEPPPTVKRWLAAYQGPPIDLAIALDFGIRVEKVGSTLVTNAPGKGRAMGKIVLQVEKGKGIVDAQYQRIPLDPGQYRNMAMRDFLGYSYERMVGELLLGGETQEKSGFNASLNADAQVNGYLGVSVCMGCHMEEYEQWKKTRHALAFYDLLEETRHWVPDCVKCHVTGYGHPEGFREFPKSNSLQHVQCETCHGPGKRHVDGFGIGWIQRTPAKSLCLQCHTKEFSPQFESMYDLYSKQVRHEKPD